MAPGYEMHMRIHHGLPSAGTPIHAHVETIAHALIYHDPAQAVGLLQASGDVLIRISPWHEQPMPRSHRKGISIDFDLIKIQPELLPRGDALLLSLCEIHDHMANLYFNMT